MAQVSGNQLYDPWKKERVTSHFVKMNEPKRFANLCDALIVEIFNKNTALGRAKPFLVCAKHREKPIHAWLNLATTLSETVRPAYPDKDYAGARAHAETLLEGEWYIASPEEFAECERKDAEDRQKALAQNTKEKLGQVNEVFGAVIQAARLQAEADTSNSKLQPAAVGASGHEQAKKKTA